VGRLVMEEGDGSKALVNIEDTDMHQTMLDMSAAKGPRKRNLETHHEHVSCFPPSPEGQKKPVTLCVAFNCPVIKRTDAKDIPMTSAVKQKQRENFKKRDYIPAYLDPDNRAEFPIPWYSYFFFTLSSLLVGFLTLIPMGVISKFHENHGTHPERIWIMCWIVFGAVIGTLTAAAALAFAGFDFCCAGDWWVYCSRANVEAVWELRHIVLNYEIVFQRKLLGSWKAVVCLCSLLG
jgi:hypothetical protein